VSQAQGEGMRRIVPKFEIMIETAGVGFPNRCRVTASLGKFESDPNFSTCPALVLSPTPALVKTPTIGVNTN
jgi:hypothetical protein